MSKKHKQSYTSKDLVVINSKFKNNVAILTINKPNYNDLFYCCVDICNDWKGLYNKAGQLIQFEIKRPHIYFPEEVLKLLK